MNDFDILFNRIHAEQKEIITQFLKANNPQTEAEVQALLSEISKILVEPKAWTDTELTSNESCTCTVKDLHKGLVCPVCKG